MRMGGSSAATASSARTSILLPLLSLLLPLLLCCGATEATAAVGTVAHYQAGAGMPPKTSQPRNHHLQRQLPSEDDDDSRHSKKSKKSKKDKDEKSSSARNSGRRKKEENRSRSSSRSRRSGGSRSSDSGSSSSSSDSSNSSSDSRSRSTSQKTTRKENSSSSSSSSDSSSDDQNSSDSKTLRKSHTLSPEFEALFSPTIVLPPLSQKDPPLSQKDKDVDILATFWTRTGARDHMDRGSASDVVLVVTEDDTPEEEVVSQPTFRPSWVTLILQPTSIMMPASSSSSSSSSNGDAVSSTIITEEAAVETDAKDLRDGGNTAVGGAFAEAVASASLARTTPSAGPTTVSQPTVRPSWQTLILQPTSIFVPEDTATDSPPVSSNSSRDHGQRAGGATTSPTTPERTAEPTAYPFHIDFFPTQAPSSAASPSNRISNPPTAVPTFFPTTFLTTSAVSSSTTADSTDPPTSVATSEEMSEETSDDKSAKDANGSSGDGAGTNTTVVVEVAVNDTMIEVDDDVLEMLLLEEEAEYADDDDATESTNNSAPTSVATSEATSEDTSDGKGARNNTAFVVVVAGNETMMTGNETMIDEVDDDELASLLLEEEAEYADDDDATESTLRTPAVVRPRVTNADEELKSKTYYDQFVEEELMDSQYSLGNIYYVEPSPAADSANSNLSSPLPSLPPSSDTEAREREGDTTTENNYYDTFVEEEKNDANGNIYYVEASPAHREHLERGSAAAATNADTPAAEERDATRVPIILASPSTAPSVIPSDGPSLEPSMLSSVSPSTTDVVVTEINRRGSCENDDSYRFSNNPRHDCAHWVEKKPKVRCNKFDRVTKRPVKFHCPLYCKSKCTTNSSPSSIGSNAVPIANERDATKFLPSTAPSDESLPTEEDDNFGFDLVDDQFPSSNYTFSPTSNPTTAPTSIEVETEEDVDFDDDPFPSSNSTLSPTTASTSSTGSNAVPIANERDASKFLPSTAPSDEIEEDDEYDDEHDNQNMELSPSSSPTTTPTSIEVETEEDVDFDHDFDDDPFSSSNSTLSEEMEVVSSVRPRCDNSKTEKFQIVGRQDKRTCGWYAYSNMCDTIVTDDDGGGVVLDVCEKSCGKCVNNGTHTPDLVSVPPTTESSPSTAPSINPTDGPSRQPSNVPSHRPSMTIANVRDATKSCDNIKTEKFQIIGRQDERTCGWYAYSNMCDNIVTDDDEGGVVSEVCQKSCGKCVHTGMHTPSMNPTATTDRPQCDNIKTEKFQIVGRQDERTCGWYAYNNMCENSVTDDDGGGTVSDVCQKACGKCGSIGLHKPASVDLPSPTPSLTKAIIPPPSPPMAATTDVVTGPTFAPTQTYNPTTTTFPPTTTYHPTFSPTFATTSTGPQCDNIKTEKFQIVGRQDKRTCGWYADSDMCDNTVTDEDGGGVVSDVCRKSCGKCVRNDRGNRVGLRAIGSTTNIDKNDRDDRFKKQTTNNLRG